jgi:archaeal flagellar protein FlaI
MAVKKKNSPLDKKKKLVSNKGKSLKSKNKKTLEPKNKKKNKKILESNNKKEKIESNKTFASNSLFSNYLVKSPHIKKLCSLHEEKKKVIDILKVNQLRSNLIKLEYFTKEQVKVIEEDLGLIKVDWDRIAYIPQGQELVLKELMKVNKVPQQLTEIERKIVEDILIYLKMFFLLLREEINYIDNLKISDSIKCFQKEENYLVKLLQIITKGSEIHKEEIIEVYQFNSKNIPITINVIKKTGEFVYLYDLNISTLTIQTEYFLEKIRKELIHEVNLGVIDFTEVKNTGIIEEKFANTIANLINKYFPDIEDDSMNFLTTYLIQKSLGLGKIDLLMDDPYLEEIAINSAEDPIWVYHKKHAWLKTTIKLDSEEQTRHFATMIGRKVGRQITVLEPLMDASVEGGNRINATIMPISNKGNTITIRKTSSKPWTITDVLKSKTVSYEAAALLWLGMQYELSFLIAGGTASGKTSMLNSLSSLFPPNQRIISIEDTREIMLPKFLHWVPMMTRLPNAEGKGGVGMIDLLVNSLRQRPDRILVGEIRRKKEAEVLFEAMHTGHSVYATVHANTVEDAIQRLTNPPIDIPKTMLPAISLIIVQYRNRMSGLRRTFQIAEITPQGECNLLFQYDVKKDFLKSVGKSKTLMNTLQLFTGLSVNEIQKDLKEKIEVLNWLVKNNINELDSIGRIIAEYYTNKANLFKYVKKNLFFE